MTVVINMSCHNYEGVISVLCTPLQVKCYQYFSGLQPWLNEVYTTLDSDLRCHRSAALVQCDNIRSRVWLQQWVVTPIEFIMSLNANPNASFSLSTCILKSPTIRTLSAARTNSDRKSENYLIVTLSTNNNYIWKYYYKDEVHVCNYNLGGWIFQVM